jgi:hypothetical protein
MAMDEVETLTDFARRFDASASTTRIMGPTYGTLEPLISLAVLLRPENLPLLRHAGWTGQESGR